MYHLSRITSVALLFLLSACVSPDRHRELEGQNRVLAQQLADAQRVLNEAAARNKTLEAAVSEMSGRVEDAQWIADQKRKLQELEQMFGTTSEGVRVVQTSEGLAFQVQGEVLFSSGSNEITRSGQDTLLQLLPILQRENKRLRIDGHTDTDPIVRSQWKTNLHLSVARSIAVTEFLIANGFPEDRIAVAGFGQFQPTTQGNGADAKARNRRVELLMLDAK